MSLVVPELTHRKLTYRGIQYTPSTEVEDPKTVKLIYRGVTINYTVALVSPAAVSTTGNPIQLIYRGVAYTRPATPAPIYRQPRAINWRYQAA
jgi:Domain of unknown function (DUF4278)